jgi:hypothetical protein
MLPELRQLNAILCARDGRLSKLKKSFAGGDCFFLGRFMFIEQLLVFFNTT